MITKSINRTRTRFWNRCTHPKTTLAVGLALGLVTGFQAEAAPLASVAAINASLKYPTYLNSEGQILSNSAQTHALAARDKAKAAYVAYRLQAGTQIPKSIPLMKSSAPLSQAIRQAMTLAASTSGRVAVRTPNGLFLVRAFRLTPPKATDDTTKPTTPPSTSPGGVQTPSDPPKEAPVPEPNTLALAGLTIACVALRRKFHRNQSASV